MARRLLLVWVLLIAGAFARADSPSTPPRYSRHVAGVFSRLGCNGGTCHGAVKGQNGFRLSLFAADPALDHSRLLREFGGRRVNVLHPDASLLLLKGTAQIPHQGGKRLDLGSFEYAILRAWIAAGATLDSIESSRTVQLRVLPAEQTLKPGELYRLKVEAKFADGSVEDITRLCSYQSLDQNVVSVNTTGQVKATGIGDTALIVRYRAEPMMAMAIVPRPSAEPLPETKPNNFIDRHILAKLRRLNLPSSALADDSTFLRRASLDLAGELPGSKEIRVFLADSNPDKRAKKIDELLHRPGHAALWTLKFCDLLKGSEFGVYADGLSQQSDAPRFQQWIRARLEENIPYDEFVARILSATSRDGRSLEEWAKEELALTENTASRADIALYNKRKSLALYWQRGAASGVPGTLQVAHAFLGLRLECAQCHRHPHDIWQQDDLLSFANFFMRVRKPGFQGDNDKKYPEVAAYVKKLNDEAKKLTDEIKKLKDTKGKQLEAEAKKAKPEADKLNREIAKLQLDAKQMLAQAKTKRTAALLKEAEELEKKAAELNARIDGKRKQVEAFQKAVTEQAHLQKEIAELDRRAKLLPEAGKRILHAEVHHLAKGDIFASITSPIGTQASRQFRLLGESQALTVAKEQDPRLQVVQWLRRPDNPYFARALVNRVWAHYFGRGIVDPPDNLSSFNPASHPELLQELAREFIQHKYDMQWLHRTIALSRTYQQSSLAESANAVDRTNYAYFYHRRLPAEVLVDALNQATGTSENMDMKPSHWPDSLKTVEIPYAPRNAFVVFMLENLGKPARNSAVLCDCERDANASMLQVLSFANHPRVWQKIADPKGQVARILKEVPDDKARVDEEFLCVLCRLPSEAERQACLKYLKESSTPAQGMQGILWSLLNTKEFLLQH